MTEETAHLICGDAVTVLRTLPDESVNCCVTSPPYFRKRDYGVVGQIGQERTPEEFIARLASVFAEVKRILVLQGTCWIVIGDSYANDSKWGGYTGGKHVEELHGAFGPGRAKVSTNLPPKSLIGIPWRLAFAMQDQGWILRAENIWHKPNGLTESVADRTTRSHEHIFHFSKSANYYYNADAIREPFATDPKEGYPGRAYITGRGDQDTALVRGNDRGRSGGFPPKSHKGSTFNRGKTGVNGMGRVCDCESKDNALGRNKRSVWTIPTTPSDIPHFAVMPEAVARPCILAGCPEGGLVLDPFAGPGTTGVVALLLKRCFVGIDINPEYLKMGEPRLYRASSPLFSKEEGVSKRKEPSVPSSCAQSTNSPID